MLIKPLFLGTVGLPELGIIAAVLLLMFGGKKIPQLTKGMVDSVRNFRGAMKEGETAVKDIKDELDDVAKSANDALK